MAALRVLALVLCLAGPSFADEPKHENRTFAEWSKELESSSLERRSEALAALAELGSDHFRLRAPALSKLRPAMKVAELRLPALRALTRLLEPQDAIPLLLQHLTHERPQAVRYCALECLASLEDDAAPAIPVLTSLLDDQDLDHERVYKVLISLDLRGKPALPKMLEVLNDTDKEHEWESACKVIQAAGFRDPTVLAGLKFLIESKSLNRGRADRSPAIREAYLALGSAEGRLQSPALALLRTGLKSPESFSRFGACQGVTRLGSAGATALPELLPVISEFGLVSGLGQLGQATPAVIRVITQKLGAEADHERRDAALALYELGPGAEAAVPALAKRLSLEREPRWFLRAIASVRAGTGRVPQEITPLLASSDPHLVFTVVRALEEIGGAEGTALLEKCCAHPLWWIRRGALESLGRSKSHTSLPRLLAALEDKDPSIRQAAAYAIGLLGRGTPASIAALRSQLESDPNPGVRFQAAVSLGALGAKDPASLKALEAATQVDDSELALAAAGANFRLGRPRPIGLDPLLVALRSKDEDVRFSALLAIGHGPSESSREVVAALTLLLERRGRSRDRLQVFEALAKMGPSASAAIPALEKVLADPANRYERERLEELLGQIRGK